MNVKDAVLERRSVRSFTGEEVPLEVLEELVDGARQAPAAANRQPLEYVAVTDPALCEEVFAALKWAAYIAPAGDPQPGHRPTAYIVVLRRTEYQLEAMAGYDVGAAVQTILLMAVEKGLAACWLKSVNIPKVKTLLNVPEDREVDSVIALGRPDEHPVRVDLTPEERGLEVIKYYRDEKGQHFVPKRALASVLHIQKHRGL
jgi:nitroreductase